MFEVKQTCFHCGESCPNEDIHIDDKVFCCAGCQSVFTILNQHDLDGYYCLNTNPGVTVTQSSIKKFQFLDDETIAAKIISFKNEKQTQVEFYLPHIHCSSCLWLLENLYKLNEGVMSAHVNFGQKKVKISFLHQQISLRKVAELLTSIGYEPFITMQDYEEKSSQAYNKTSIIKLGIAGFCFANIMLISFPEYLGLNLSNNATLSMFFRYSNLVLSLPVFFYAAQEFFINAWANIKQKFINIDAPIALAILITFIRSIYEIVSHTGPGYLDSMSGIVFFMLIGRSLQHKTFNTLKFDRDYKSYFPISVHVIQRGEEINCKIQDVKKGDLLKLYHQEIIPVDCMLSSKSAQIDYSFVSGENELHETKAGELIYAGGRVQSNSIEVLTTKPFSQSSFTSLWNNQVFTKNETPRVTFVDTISKYFSMVLLIIAAASFLYWHFFHPAYALNALTAVLIVACPCTLLLTSSYTYGFIISYFSKKGMFVKNSDVINKLSKIDHIVFDKTGTLTEINKQQIEFVSKDCTNDDLVNLLSIMHHSSHPLSQAISNFYKSTKIREVKHFKEVAGEGLEAWLDDQYIKIGNASFVNAKLDHSSKASIVYFSIDNSKTGYFLVSNNLKGGVEDLVAHLSHYKLSLLSGDNDSSFEQMGKIFPAGSQLLFRQSPQQKLDYIKSLQEKGERVLMLGDGINDAGALKQSDIGVSVVGEGMNFSPASDAILNTNQVHLLVGFLRSAKSIKRLIIGTFIYSLFYNVIGLSIAISAHLKPVIAAILMPASSLSVIFIAFIGTNWIYNKYLTNN